VADACQRQQLGAGNPAGQRLGVTEGEQRIGRAVDHQGRGGDLVEPAAGQLALLGQRVVRHAGRHVGGAVHDPGSERPHVRLVEVFRRLELPLVAGEVVDDGRPFGPIGFRDLSREPGPQLLRHRRELRPARHRGAGREQDQRVDAIRMRQRDLLREGAAHRDAGQLSTAPPERVQHPDGVGRQVRAGIPRLPGRVADRLTGIAMVVPDDEPPACR
jgi:hypothetical protein